jgi:hypothetical protein|tara:strand:+ start:31 stop:228 length:198 start_codon:yes stop_codon:yes gene_type:complete
MKNTYTEKDWEGTQMTKISLNFEFSDSSGIETSEDFFHYLLDLWESGDLRPVIDAQLEIQRARYH